MTVYNSGMNERWNIEQLTAAVEQALEAAGGPVQSSGRVRMVPDLRTIRYYTTLGLIAPPAEMRGRKALYGRRHLLALVAIKRLQARGLSLAEIQRSLVGASEQTLNQLAGLPSDIWQRLESVPEPSRPSDDFDASPVAPPEASGQAPTRPVTPSRNSFWADAPVLRQSSVAASPSASEPLSADWALHVPIANGIEVILRGLDPERLDRGSRAELLARVERFAEELRTLGLQGAVPAPEDE